MSQLGLALIPFALTARHLVASLHHLEAIPALRLLYVDDPSSRAFALLLNHTNELAFGGATKMGMPPWVMLDCGVLSGAIVGFATPTAALSTQRAERLGVPRGYDHELAPISEYCGCPTLKPGCVSGFSLQSQITGQGLARRTKALAMLLYGATSQVGVTQWENAAIRTHCAFGPLEILMRRPSVHTHAEKSFVYELKLPERDELMALYQGRQRVIERALPDGERWEIDPSRADHLARIDAALSDGRRAWIVAPGWRREGADGVRIKLLCSTDPRS